MNTDLLHWLQDVFNPSQHLFYPIKSSSIRGRCVIANGLQVGTQINQNLLDLLKGTFKSLKFKCKLYQLNKNDILKTVLEAESRIDHSAYDCFLMIILTDNQSKEVFFQNIFTNKPNEFQLNSIFDYFTGDKSTLNKKPKIFFLQCFNEGEITAIVDSSIQHDGNTSSQFSNIFSKYSSYADFLLFYSPFSETKFIEKLCSILTSNLSYDLVSILTKLINELKEEQIAVRKARKDKWTALPFPLRHIPYISSTLTRLISFNFEKVNYNKMNNLRYSRDKKLTGKCVIINIENFLNLNKSSKKYLQLDPSMKRNNTKEDGLLVAQTFDKLGFEVKHYYDKMRAEADFKIASPFKQGDQYLSKNALQTILSQELIHDFENSKRKYFVLWIMTHGCENGYLLCHDKYIRVNELLDCFTEKECPNLKGIPKLIFVVACKGDKYDDGVKIFHDAATNDMDLCCLPNDTLICYSTYPGYISYRNWLINSICTILLKEMAKSETTTYDLMTILTIAFQYIAYEKMSNTLLQHPDKPEWNNKKLIPYINSTLTQSIELFVDDEDESEESDY